MSLKSPFLQNLMNIKSSLAKATTTITATSPSTTSTVVQHWNDSKSLFSRISLFAATLTLHTLSLKKMNLVSQIYDSMIVHMTEKWYQSVLSQLDDNSIVLDVGIGTAGALLRCQDIIKSKNLKIIGIDYNQYYISSAQESIKESGMTDYITVHCINLYDAEKLQQVLPNDRKSVDVVYFSGSFSLLPDPKGALLMIMPLLKNNGSSSSGLVYITQTYQRHVVPLLSSVKPLLKYLTTIDFGQLVKVDEINRLLNDEELISNGIVLKSHNVIDGSLDNYWQAAYISVLEIGESKK